MRAPLRVILGLAPGDPGLGIEGWAPTWQIPRQPHHLKARAEMQEEEVLSCGNVELRIEGYRYARRLIAYYTPRLPQEAAARIIRRMLRAMARRQAILTGTHRVEEVMALYRDSCRSPAFGLCLSTEPTWGPRLTPPLVSFHTPLVRTDEMRLVGDPLRYSWGAFDPAPRWWEANTKPGPAPRVAMRAERP